MLVVIVLMGLGATTAIVGMTSQSRIERGVAEMAQEQFGLPVSEMSCPAFTGLKAVLHTGATSHCTALVAGAPETFTVTEQDGLDYVRYVLDHSIATTTISTKIGQELTEVVGAPVSARCGPADRRIVILSRGGTLACQAVGPTGRQAALTFTVTDDQGSLETDTSPAAIRAALR